MSPGEEHLPGAAGMGGVGEGILVLLERVGGRDWSPQCAIGDEGGQRRIGGGHLVVGSRVDPVLLPEAADVEVAEDDVGGRDDYRGAAHTAIADEGAPVGEPRGE